MLLRWKLMNPINYIIFDLEAFDTERSEIAVDRDAWEEMGLSPAVGYIIKYKLL